MRNHQDKLSLDTNGFIYTTEMISALTDEDFGDTGKVSEVYISNGADYLKRSLGAKEAVFLAQNIRRRHESFPALPRANYNTSADQPIQGAHVDYPTSRVHDLVRRIFKEEAGNQLLRENRIQVIHVWRPLRGPVIDWPLALCDYSSLDVDTDLVATDNVYPHVVSETFNVFHNPKHAWYYLSNQMPHESLIFKGFDNAEKVAKHCPHAAFELMNTWDPDQFRESVECAFLLVYSQ
ncbi:uncharacterized protein BDZ99DRAFT_284733 [Mytilinidion resinicola]|uniref:Methyltransferase n=1 Tax=Mytilinidion resinicola TaxID=574789 RepID=A0A6A6YT41_9PEZI|nr:uncharacterized protein BDZ99DRAFT_284733 [Mytilinidion resinicola]KAF2811980.1 hypothetical protein BDZ99DRAFT_284733 [Mytilinidion resinicola]